jgi:adenosine kinase
VGWRVERSERANLNQLFILNLSAPFIAQFFKDPLDQILPYVDILIGNESEAAAYAESHELGITDVKEIAEKLATLPKKNTNRQRTVVFTQGTDPTIAVTATKDGKTEAIEKIVHAIGQEKINDTNGAGYVLFLLFPIGSC